MSRAVTLPLPQSLKRRHGLHLEMLWMVPVDLLDRLCQVAPGVRSDGTKGRQPMVRILGVQLYSGIDEETYIMRLLQLMPRFS